MTGLIREGDEVTIHIPSENWDWGYRPVEKQDGVKAVVLGFTEIHYSRICSYGRKPGVYQNRSWVRVKTETGKEYAELDSRLKLIDQEEADRRMKKLRDNGPEESAFLRDLPETKFWEGDTVMVRGEKLMIVGIEYGWRTEQRPECPYRVSEKFGAGWYSYANEDIIELVERGNVWKHYHNVKLIFNTLHEEANFYMMIGKTKTIRNPANDLYKWTLEEVLRAIRDGSVDGFTQSRGFVIDGQTICDGIDAVVFEDRELGERVRQSTIEGFKEKVV